MFDGIWGALTGIYAAFAGVFNGLFGLSADGDAGRGMINQPDEVAPIYREDTREPRTIHYSTAGDPTPETMQAVAEKKALNFEDVTKHGGAANDGDGGGTVLNAKDE